MKKLLLLLLLFALFSNAYSQKASSKLSYPEIDSLVYLCYQQGDYEKAIPYLEVGIEKANIEFGANDSTYAEYIGNPKTT